VLGLLTVAALTAANGLSVVLAPERTLAVLPGINSTSFAVGTSLGITAASQLINGRSNEGSAPTADYEQALWMSVFVATAAFLASLTVPRPENR
jgi:hypothetical protein